MTRKPPSYRKHPCGQAIVTINKKMHYLGKYGTDKSKERYRDVLAEYWHPAGEFRGEWPTTEELMARYLIHAKRYYADSNEYEHVILALRPLRQLFPEVPTNKFGPKMLSKVRDQMVADGITRQGANKRVTRLRRMFKWGVSEELVPSHVIDALRSLPPLSRGRTDAPEAGGVKRVDPAHIQDVIDHAPKIIGDMIQVQLLMVCRPGELVGMTRRQIDTTGDVWSYRPVKHKNQWRDQGREIQIGPRAQQILLRYLPAELDAPIFSPRRFHRNARFRDSYDTRQYRKSIWSACDAAGIPHWSPGQLRHNAATFVREQYGLEAAKAVCGHAKIDATQLYAEEDKRRAVMVASEVG